MDMRLTGENGQREIDKPMTYEIKLQGCLDKSWSSWLEGMRINYEDNCTVLTGKMADQSALRGLLTKIWDLNQILISINQIPVSETVIAVNRTRNSNKDQKYGAESDAGGKAR
jgi:hypothetical protein